MKVQVVVCTATDSATLCLEHTKGIFLEVQSKDKCASDEEEEVHSEWSSEVCIPLYHEYLAKDIRRSPHSWNARLTLLKAQNGKATREFPA